MHKIEIADETADLFFKDIFKQDYLGLKRDIVELESRGESLYEYEFLDLEFNRRMVTAFEILMEYYFTDSDAEQLKNG